MRWEWLGDHDHDKDNEGDKEGQGSSGGRVSVWRGARRGFYPLGASAGDLCLGSCAEGVLRRKMRIMLSAR